MRYAKATIVSEGLKAFGYPQVTYYEIDGHEAVVRLVEILQDGRIWKESLESMRGVVFGSLRDDAPKPARYNEGDSGICEESTQDEFEGMWGKAEWSPGAKSAMSGGEA